MNRTVIKIEGMACPMCEAHISETIRKAVPDAKKVSASHKKGEASFLTEGEVDLALLQQDIDKTGYRYLSGETTPYVKRGLFG